MIIAHISDVHVGPQFVPDAYDTAAMEILKLKPDAIVASGDFTENGLYKEYKAAAEKLLPLRDFPMITVPGNHDYRFTGYLPYKELFGGKETLTVGNALFLAVGTARPDRDEGEVGHRQNLWLEESLKRHKQKIKVIVMHHHLVQVPDTGVDRITVLDAGDVLKSLLTARPSIVLCGHRHRPWMWRINGMVIGHAGTTSSERMRGFFANTYNIVEIDESSGRSKVWLKIIGGKKVDMEKVVKESRPYFPEMK